MFILFKALEPFIEMGTLRRDSLDQFVKKVGTMYGPPYVEIFLRGDECAFFFSCALRFQTSVNLIEFWKRLVTYDPVLKRIIVRGP